MSKRGRPTNVKIEDKMAAKEACQSFEATYNHIEELLTQFNTPELKDNGMQLAFYIGKLGALYQKIVEKTHVFEEVE